MTAAPDIEDVLRGFLSDEVMSAEEAQGLATDSDLLVGGIINSLTLAHLAVFLEERYAMTVEPAEFELGNFRTLRAICEFVDTKRRAG